MAFFKYRDKDVYYEVHGEGTPIIFLNGIMMSTKSWEQFINELSEYHQLILVDFLDQGRSDKMHGIEYKHDLQVELVEALRVHLDLDEFNLFGISYGGEIAIQYAIKYQQHITRLLLFNTAAWTSPWLEEIGRAWNYAAHDPAAYYATSIPVIYSPMFYVEQIEWMNNRKDILLNVFSNKEFMDGMVRLTNSSNGYDERIKVKEIQCKTLIVSSEYDFVTPKNEQEFIAKEIMGSSYVFLPKVGHASMYENPTLFISLVLGFVL